MNARFCEQCAPLFRYEKRVWNLKLALAMTIGLRMLCIAIYHPMDHLFSDWLRHWLNGERFYTPDLMGSIDPLMYQVWMYIVRGVTHDDRVLVGMSAMLLSGSLPWLWYRALREVMPKIPALTGGILIGIMPSFIMIYSYFANETLLLPLIAAAVWMSLRAARKGTLFAWTVAAAVWALASYTRMIALPMALFVLAWVLYSRWQRHGGITRQGLISLKLRLLVAASLFAVMTIPACWHSRYSLNFCAPFGAGYIPKIQRISMQNLFTMEVINTGSWGYMAPSMTDAPLRPLSDWKSLRNGETHVTIDRTHGREDWEKELARVRALPKDLSSIYDYSENFILFFFDPSWPDNNPHYVLGWITIQNRWIWLPVALGVLLLTTQRWRSLDRRERMIPLLALTATLLMLGQQSALMEGRYRKPVEPLWVASLVILLRKRRPEKTPAAACDAVPVAS